MSFISAFGKYVLRKANDAITEKQTQNAKKQTYKETGKKIKNAKKNGEYFNAKKEYHSNLSEKMDKINQAHDTRSQYIDDM